MKVCFICSTVDREPKLGDAFVSGCRKLGDDGFVIDKGDFKRATDVEADAYCFVGVKSHELFQQLRSAGKNIIYFDKGYFRHRATGSRTWEYWRVAVNGHHPTNYLEAAKHHPLRWMQMSAQRRVKRRPWHPGNRVMVAGSSLKYHNFSGIKYPTEYYEKVVEDIKQYTNRDIIYRPKPGHFQDEPVKGALFSSRDDSLHEIIHGLHCIVTHGSNICFEAMLAGTPTIVLGDAVSRPISSVSLRDVEEPYLATEEELNQWFANIAWCMFTEEEMASGLAWMCLKPQLEGDFLDEKTVDKVFIAGEKPTKHQLKGYTGDFIEKKPRGKKRRKENKK